MQPRPDVRLLDAPMQPVECGTCHVWVQVRKSTWDQTSIQWNTAAVSDCLERAAGDSGVAFRGCAALTRSIREAVVRGDIDVVQAEARP